MNYYIEATYYDYDDRKRVKYFVAWGESLVDALESVTKSFDDTIHGEITFKSLGEFNYTRCRSFEISHIINFD